MAFFSSVRLSKHFLLLDFLHGHTLYSSGRPLPLKDIPAPCIRTGQRLCEELLEPIIQHWGPISIANGFVPKDLLGARWTPHSWFPQDGAAADIVVHNWVNAGSSPIELVQAMIYRNLPFERLITYAGSEVICASAGRSPKNRGAVYENVRVPGAAKPQFISWARGGKYPSHLLGADGIKPRPDWRREEGEGIYHTQGLLRPQHLRVSEFFLALDFCRNENAIEAGRPWVPRFKAPEVLQAAACIGEILDPVKRKCGHVSITRGITRPGDGVLDNHTWDGDVFSVEFTIPLGVELPGFAHRHIIDFKRRDDAPGGTPRFTMTVRRFTPKRAWSSAVQPGAK